MKTGKATEEYPAEEPLMRSAQQYRELFENAGSGTVIVDLAGRYLMVNQQAAAVYGKQPAEVVGKFMSDFLPPEAADREKMIEAGCNGYIEKPINPETFVAEIERCLGG